MALYDFAELGGEIPPPPPPLILYLCQEERAKAILINWRYLLDSVKGDSV